MSDEKERDDYEMALSWTGRIATNAVTAGNQDLLRAAEHCRFVLKEQKARVQELEAERDKWQARAADTLKTWDEENEKRHDAEEKVQELEREVAELKAPKARAPIYKNPNCTIDHPGQSCNVACGYE